MVIQKTIDAVTHRDKPYVFPASLSQRYSATLIDIGLFIGAAIWFAIIYYYVLDMPYSRPRYILPHPSMGWSRVLSSITFFSIPVIYFALFIASPLKATPGMIAMQIRVTDIDGNRIKIMRSFVRVLFTFAPLFIGNYLILIGVALEMPIIHLGLLNLFSLMLILQCIWFFPVAFLSSKKSIPDYVLGTKVDYHSHHKDGQKGLHVMRRAFLKLMLIANFSIMGVVIAIAGLNLFDMPLDKNIRTFRSIELLGEENYSMFRKRVIPIRLAGDIVDTRCVSLQTRFLNANECPSPVQLFSVIEKNLSILETYEEDLFNTPTRQTIRKYLSASNVKVTDFYLAKLLVEQQAFQENSSEPFEKWLTLAQFWKDQSDSKQPFVPSTYARIHFAHVLRVLPDFLQSSPVLLETYGLELDQLLSITDEQSYPIDEMFGHEYALYETMLGNSLIEYFPMIQPNATRNMFLPLYQEARHNLDLDNNLQFYMDRQLPWIAAFYNPIGRWIGGTLLQNWHNHMFGTTTYLQNTALMRMMWVYLNIKREGIQKDNIPAYIASLPEDLKTPYRNHSLRYDQELHALYYTHNETRQSLNNLLYM